MTKHNLNAVPATLVPIKDTIAMAEQITRLMITYPFDLRGIEPKQDTLRRTPLCSGWMIFLNKAGSLAHIIHQLDAAEGTYIRMKVPHTIKGSSPEYLKRYFFYRMVGRYII